MELYCSCGRSRCRSVKYCMWWGRNGTTCTVFCSFGRSRCKSVRYVVGEGWNCKRIQRGGGMPLNFWGEGDTL